MALWKRRQDKTIKTVFSFFRQVPGLLFSFKGDKETNTLGVSLSVLLNPKIIPYFYINCVNFSLIILKLFKGRACLYGSVIVLLPYSDAIQQKDFSSRARSEVWSLPPNLAAPPVKFIQDKNKQLSLEAS